MVLAFLRGSDVMKFQGGKLGPETPIETFARFLAGLLVSEDFHHISKIFIACHFYFYF